MNAPRQVENRFSAGPHRPDRAIALFGPHLIPTPSPPGLLFPLFSFLSFFFFFSFSLFFLSSTIPPPFCTLSLSHLLCFTTSSSLSLYTPTSPSFTMGSVSNGSKPGTFLFTSESVGEGHPDKIA